MAKTICTKCKTVYEGRNRGKCPACNAEPQHSYHFKNSDRYLKENIPRVLEKRKIAGLDGLVDGLECVIINTEPNKQRSAVVELLRYTGLEFSHAFEDSNFKTYVLKTKGSADFLIRSRVHKANPFVKFNRFPQSITLPHTRLETFVFKTNDLEKYVSIQKSRGVKFLTDDILKTTNYSYIQTKPSLLTGNSTGFIQWRKEKGNYSDSQSKNLRWNFDKPKGSYLNNIGFLDHAATRVEAKDRDAAIIEFMELTNYNFDLAIYVNPLNSITNVARVSKKDFAMVFTSGITPFVNDRVSGPTEKFMHHFGPRVHHLAFRTKRIEETFTSVKEDGMGFLIELVGSPSEGLKQTFTLPSKNTFLVTEYIHRYGDFDGFFTKSNVTLLTAATAKQ
jgi:4-hydroxyphenylpyruvate dioxygenase-like putative hemolysin